MDEQKRSQCGAVKDNSTAWNKEFRLLFDKWLAVHCFPGTFQAVYNATKAFISSFSSALREELKKSGVTVSCLMRGAAGFFKHADLVDTSVGQAEEDNATAVARIGYEAMMDGEGDVVSGWKDKLQAAVANVTRASVTAQQHAKMAKPGSDKKS